MSRHRILAATLHVALQRSRDGQIVDESFLNEQDRRFKELIAKHPNEIPSASLDLEEPPIPPWEEIDVELSAAGVRRILGPFEEIVDSRLSAIKGIVTDSIRNQPDNVRDVVSLFGEWMRKGTRVRIIGAGRALLAASIPANRLAHGGASVWILGDRSPLPNSRLGGGIIAASASGETAIVLEIMKLAQKINNEKTVLKQDHIVVVGISHATSEKAKDFRSLCSKGYFLGIEPETHTTGLFLQALGDIKEYAISELFDLLVVAAGLEIGVNFRLGHEDLVGGATGPWHQHNNLKTP